MAKREVDIKVKYIPDTSALKSALSGAQKIDFKIGGSGLKKELLAPVQNAMREVNKAIASGADNKTLLKLFQDVGKAADSAKLKATGMLTEINSGFNSAGNQKLLTDLEKYQKELDKVEKKISNWENKYGNKAMSQMKMDLGVGGISDAKKQTAELEEQVKLGKTLTQQELDRLDALKKYINTWNERKELADRGVTRGGMESEASVLRSKISDIMTTVELPKTNVEWTKQLTPIINALGQAAGLSAQEINKLTIAIGQEDKAAKDAANENKKEALKLADVVTGTFLGTSVSSMFESALRRGVEFFKEYDETLTRTMMVTGMTRDEVNSLTSSYNRLANQLSSTTKDVAAAQLVFYQQGLGTSEALKMTEASIAISKTGGIEAEEAANRLTAAVRGYKLAANDAMDIADKMSALDAAAASSVDELTIAMQKSASQARMAGLDLDYYMAYLSTMQEVTREAPENIGTAMKSITSRLQEITDIGKVEEDGTTFSNVAKALNSVGIAAVDSTGQLRSLQDVMNDLGPMWATLDKNHKAYLATVLAGNRQQSRFIALMDNYDRAMELVSVSQNASGESAKQLRAYNQGLEASFTRLNNAWQQFATKIADSDMIKGVIDLLTDFVEILNKIPKPITQTIIPLVALTKGLQLLGNAGTLFSQAKGFIGQKLGIPELNKDIKNMDNVLGQGMSTINKFGQTLKDAFDGFGNHKKQIDEVTKALEGNTATLQSNTTAQEGSTLAKQSDDGVDAQEVVEANTNSAAQAAMKKAYDLATKSVKIQLDIMSTNSDAYIEEQERAIREAEAQIKKNKAKENDLLAANKKERSRRKSELQELRNAYERKVKNPASREMGGELYTDAIESLQKKGLLGEKGQLSLFGDSKDEQLIAEEMDRLAHEYGLGYHELQEVLKKESNEIFRINNEAIEEIRKKNKDLANEVSQIMKNITGYKNAVGKNTDILTPEQLLSGREASLQKLDTFKSAKAVSGRQLKDLASDKFLGNFEKLNAAFGKINIGGGLVAGSLAKMGTSFLGLDDDMSSALSTSVGLATSFAKFAPPWGAIIGASIGAIQFAFNKLWPSAEKVSEKITELQSEMDELKQKSSNIELNLDTYTSLINKLDKTEEETAKLKDATDALAESLPRAVQGYDSFGNAIINTGIAMSELSNLQTEQAENAKKQIGSFNDLQKAQISGWEKVGSVAAEVVGAIMVVSGNPFGALLFGAGMADQLSWDERQIDANKKVIKENYSEIYSAMQEVAVKTIETGSRDNKQLRQAWSNALINDALNDAMNGDSIDETSVEKVGKEMEELFKELDGYTLDSLINLSIDAKTEVEIQETTWNDLKDNITKQVKAKLAHLDLSDEKINAIIDIVMDGSWNLTNVKSIQEQLKQAINASTDKEFQVNGQYFSDSLGEMQQDMFKFLESMDLLDARFANMFADIGGNEGLGKIIRNSSGEIDESRAKIALLNEAYKQMNSESSSYSETELENLRNQKQELEKELQSLKDENESYDKGWFGNFLFGDERASYSEETGKWIALVNSDGAKLTDRLNDVQEKLDNINTKLGDQNGNLEKTKEVIKSIIASIEATEPPTFNELSESLSKINSQFQQIFSLAESLDETSGKMSLDNISEMFDILSQFEPESFANMSLDSYALWMDSIDKINNGLYEQNGVLIAQTSVMDGLNQLASVNAKLQIEKYNATIDASNAELQYQNEILQTQLNAVNAAIASLEANETTDTAKEKAQEQLDKLDTLFSAERIKRAIKTNNTILTYTSKFAAQYAKIIREANEGKYSGEVELENINTDSIVGQLKSDLKGELDDLIDKKDLESLYNMRNQLTNQIQINNDTISKTNALKKKVTDYLSKESTNLAGVAKGYENASDKAKDYNEKLERTLTLLEKIQGLQHKIDENETFKDLYDGYSGEDYGRLLMSNLDLAQQQYEVYKDLFDMQQQMTNQAAGDLLDSPYGQMFKIMDNGDIGWADASMYDKYKNLPNDMKEDIDNLVEAFQKQRDALRDTEQDLSKYAQEIKKVREELVEMEIYIENELVNAIKNREKILHDARMKALDDEIAMIDEAVERRQKARETENQNKELYQAQEALRRATLDSSGKNNASLLQLQQDLEDKQLEISEKRFEQDMEDRKNWLQDTKDAETETYEYRLETMTWYWEEVQAIQEAGTEAMMQALITWNEEYRTTSELQQREMKQEWQFTMDAMRAATDMGAELGKLTQDIVTVTQTVEAMDVQISKLPGTWQKATDAANAYSAAASRAHSYGGVSSTPSANLNTENNNKPKVDKDVDKKPASAFDVGQKVKGSSGAVIAYDRQSNGTFKQGNKWLDSYSMNMFGYTIREKEFSNGTWYYKVDVLGEDRWFNGHQLKKYADGGMIDYTGPAWVDGNKTHPEAFLSAYQTEQIGALAGALDSNTVNNVSGDSNISFGSINFNVASMSSAADGRKALDIFVQGANDLMAKKGVNTKINLNIK